LLQDDMLEMWTVSVPMFMPAMLVLVLMGMLVLVPMIIPAMLEAFVVLISMDEPDMSMLEFMLIPDMDIVALGRIDIPDIVLLILIDPPST
jgi:hypothetical protein